MHSSSPPVHTHDRHWRGSARFAAFCALAFAALALLVDLDAGTLTGSRTALWTTLSTAIFLVLLPQHVSAGPNWIAAQGPLHRRAVRTDALTSVSRCGSVGSHLVLRDTYGHRLELDVRVLTANPLIWHELDTGVRRSLAHGRLRQSTSVLQHLGRQIDNETARAIFHASGLS